jgi:hypothetical protein
MLWIKLLVQSIHLLFYPNKRSGALQIYQLLLLPSGALVYRHITVYPAILGGCKVYCGFRKEPRGTCEWYNWRKYLYKNTSIKPQGTCECYSWRKLRKYERLTPVHRVTKLNRCMVPSFTRGLSPLQKYVRPSKYICDYYRVFEWANWPDPRAYGPSKYKLSIQYDVMKRTSSAWGVKKNIIIAIQCSLQNRRVIQ